MCSLRSHNEHATMGTGARFRNGLYRAPVRCSRRIDTPHIRAAIVPSPPPSSIGPDERKSPYANAERKRYLITAIGHNLRLRQYETRPRRFPVRGE